MGTDLTTIKRESNLLKKNDNIVSKPKKKLGRKNHPPRTFVPSIDELISVDIKMGEDHARKYVFYFAAESKDMTGFAELGKKGQELLEKGETL